MSEGEITSFSEWAWRWPHYEELHRRSLGELSPSEAAQTAWRFQQARIDVLESELLRLCGPVCPHDGKRASEHDADSIRYPGCVFVHQSDDGPWQCGFKADQHSKYAPEHEFVATHELWPEGVEWFTNLGAK